MIREKRQREENKRSAGDISIGSGGVGRAALSRELRLLRGQRKNEGWPGRHEKGGWLARRDIGRLPFKSRSKDSVKKGRGVPRQEFLRSEGAEGGGGGDTL